MVTKDKDEELALFLEMRRRDIDKDKAQINLLVNSASVDASLVTMSPTKIQVRKTAAEKFLYSENDKSDYNWLLTPPRTPSLEMESQKPVMSQNGMSKARAIALTSRLTNIQEEPASRTNIGSKRITLPSNGTNRRPSSTSKTRPPTPTGRATLLTATKPSRSSTPTSRATLPTSTKPSRSSTPSRTVRPAKSAARSSTPTRETSNPASAISRGSSAMKSRTWKPNEMPGFSLEVPPNLRTSLPERPASASRGRPVGANARSSCVESGSKVGPRPRQQSCSPARGRTTNSGANNGSRISMPSKRRNLSKGSDDVNPVLMGTKMVERVVNMRKLAPPKQDDQHTTSNSSSGVESSGFGRTLSKKSLDMALRHMDIRRSVPGKLRPLTSIPASSMYSVRSGGSTKSKTNSGLDSPHATSSNASTELSNFFDGNEMESINGYASEGASQVSELQDTIN